MIEFNTIQYESAHGKSPRGRGGWAFAATRNPKPSEIIWAHGTYAEAKRQVRESLKGARGTLYVLS